MRHDATGKRAPRQVWIAALTQEGIEGGDCGLIIERALEKMRRFLPRRPDVYCLPETFPYLRAKGRRPPIAEAAAWESPIVAAMSAFAKANGCYVIAPLHTRDAGRVYNAAVVLDRDGRRLGEYRKNRTTVEEMGLGVVPGSSDPPVFQLDFGTIGIQICFDIEWPDAWRRLRERGAEIVFWPSAFGGGARVSTMALLNRYCVVSSTVVGSSRICDITGETVAQSGRWDPDGVCAPINLEKTLVHTWPNVERFPDLQAKYGRAVRVRNLHEEEFSIIECCSPEVRVADILQEFGIQSYGEHLREAEWRQEELR